MSISAVLDATAITSTGEFSLGVENPLTSSKLTQAGIMAAANRRLNQVKIRRAVTYVSVYFCASAALC